MSAVRPVISSNSHYQLTSSQAKKNGISPGKVSADVERKPNTCHSPKDWGASGRMSRTQSWDGRDADEFTPPPRYLSGSGLVVFLKESLMSRNVGGRLAKSGTTWAN